ncbi:hypothetical protein [Flavobacterium silvaticum]|uniref:Lipoprotein n=1 Tax=Flavobacterium silvaticum TaxID=1852020 RepID=A0A972JHR4_9FLAO|nr:hypothetical protein [Flavobacterium silvaticum]NMH26517.1 hypothetical protein [Flavobacterium silvaticum]
MKRIFFFVLVAVSISCNRQKPLGNKFFDFDSSDYYSLNLNDRQISKLNLENATASTIISGYYPESINEISEISKLGEIGYTKTTLNAKQVKELSQIFRENSNGDFEFAACLPIYRDIFVLKKNSKIVGIVKLCYECGQASFRGTKANTENFGANEEFLKINLVLKR